MTDKIVPRISETEWEVMRAIWSRHPASASEIIDRLLKTDPSWHPKTAKTLLTRLVRKGALGFVVQGRIYLYQPLVGEQECIAVESSTFLERVFGGALKPMLAHFVEAHGLTQKDLDELKHLLDRDSGKRKQS